MADPGGTRPSRNPVTRPLVQADLSKYTPWNPSTSRLLEVLTLVLILLGAYMALLSRRGSAMPGAPILCYSGVVSRLVILKP